MTLQELDAAIKALFPPSYYIITDHCIAGGTERWNSQVYLTREAPMVSIVMHLMKPTAEAVLKAMSESLPYLQTENEKKIKELKDELALRSAI